MIEAQELKQFARLVADELDRLNNQPQFLNEQDAAKLCGLTARSLQEMRQQKSADPIRPGRTGGMDEHGAALYSTKEAMTGADEDSRHP